MAALTVHIVPSGDSLQPPGGQPPPTLEVMHAWIAAETGIKEADQIILTSKGKHVQQQTLLTENEFYLYDRELFTSTSAGRKTIPASPVPEPWAPDPFPTDLKAPDSLKAWQTLFKQRRQWASSILQTCRAMCDDAELYLAKRRTIESGLRVATSKHEAYLQKLGQQHNEAKVWFEEVNRDAGANIQLLEEDLEKMRGVPVIPAFGRFFGKGDGSPSASASVSSSRRRSGSAATATPATTETAPSLASFVDRAAAKKAAHEGRAALDKCGATLQELGEKLDSVTAEYDGLIRDLGSSQTRSLRDDPDEPRKQLNEIQAIANKVASDHEHVLGLRAEPNGAAASLRTASKMALLHTKNFLPNLRDCAVEMADLLRYAADAKNGVTRRALDHLQTIARVETVIPALRKAYEGFEISEQGLAALDRVATASQLPITYGSLLLEGAKRREWADKMRHDSAALAEEIAGYQEEEQRRRRKWMRGVANVVTDSAAVEGRVLSVEVNLQGDDQTWPNVTRDDVDEYIKSLSAVPGFEAVVESLSQTLKQMDQPTRQQVKRAKAFKMGSVHEAGFGRGSLLLRGDDEAKVLREANLKLEDEAKGYKSRIRKLEDILHRQSMFNRVSAMGNASQSSPFSDQGLTSVDAAAERPLPLSPRQGHADLSRRSSTSSRRVSFNNQTQDEKSLARRIVQLEADLVAARDARARQERLHANALEEANSTKKDLLENMEAQQREFATERRALEDEIARARVRVEEVEDDFDRLAGSRENDKTGAEARFQVLLAERDEARREAAERVRSAERRSKSLERDARERTEREVERMDLLRGLHGILDPEGTEEVPQEPGALIAALEELVQRSQDQAREVAQAVALARSENGELNAVLEGARAETAKVQAELEERDAEVKRVVDELRTERGRAESIAAELDSEREHLRDLREKFAEGETGSEALRLRLEEEQGKVSALSTKLAEAKSHVNGLDVELLVVQGKQRKLMEAQEMAEKRLQERAARAKAVSQRLYAHNDRLMRLLQALGFVVSFEEDKMKLERASKAGGASALMSASAATGGGSVMAPIQRTISGSTTTRWIEELADVSLLLWPEKDLPQDEEAKFNEYMDRIGRFNLDTFAEAITKRMRDMEHTARKWQREAKSYRERAHRVQAEAHDKIAFRSFKEGDLALFLPTRNQAMKPWAAFNVGAPHYFLREQEGHRLVNRDWLVARISKVEERIVDLSKTLNSTGAVDAGSLSDAGTTPYEDDNPFDLSDGLRWYLLDAQEEKVGAPSTPGLGKAVVSTSTVSATRDETVNAKAATTGAIRIKKKPTDAVEEASKALSRSLDSRRSSHSSKRSVPVPAQGLGINTKSATGGNESLLSPDTAATPSEVHRNGGNGPGPSHLRTASDVASMLRSGDETTRESAALQEEHHDHHPQYHSVSAMSARGTPAISPVKPGASLDALRRNMSQGSNLGSTSAAASPVKPKPNPAKMGVWDSLFQYEISLQGGGGGGKKKT